ncbi:hypothetical protein [Actimicrobium sp. CCI2.3]|uniref:hypothetical protein n=1 Tax=Actimicrobium sp. CCI2.3 TaxID=3048616 RepID=UPI002AB51FF1|nr:hypothetical protein [Actimicrobium sp. CCI2.3]MDY7576133.1 hypothetical protein [Actimicrobium sp. CCI2.3]MEB0023465.1 hypothetical protein [Actimicrobium sp. CCI2.3]
MTESDLIALRPYASKYIWWKTPDEAMLMPERVVAQVMNIGDYSDVQAVANRIGETYLHDVLQHAEIGQFSERSWAYWHYRLGLISAIDVMPAMPKRRIE